MARDSSCKSIDITSVVEEKPEAVNVEALGRKRPDVLLRHGWGLPLSAPCWFRSLWRTSSSEAFRPSCLLSWDLFIFPRLQKTWPSSVITLVAGAFILPCGRLADMFGGYIVFHVGIIWFIAWTIITGFSNSFLMLVFCRAMEGLGAAMFLPAGVSLLGRIYRPGPRKNFIFSLYGAITPIGFFSGIMIGGMSSQVMTWGWYFWIGAMLTTLCCIASLLTSPRDYVDVRKQGVTMDWWGFCTMVPGLTLFIYAITDSRQASEGWASPQIIVCLVLGVLFLGAAIYVEGWKASAPLIPPEIFQVKFMKRMILTLFLTWGVFALYLFFANSYINNILHKTSMITALWFAPWAAGGLVLSISSGLILHILPNRILLIISLGCQIVAVLFFALMPASPNYWAWIFPAMLAEAACVDILWTVSNVFLTTSLPRYLQGLAGALIYITVYMGSAFFLAVAAVVMGQFKAIGLGPKSQYKGLFWIAVGIGAIALVLCLFMDLGKAGSEMITEEKIESDSGSESESDSSSVGDARSVTGGSAATPHARMVE